jgi:hypothetical protein
LKSQGIGDSVLGVEHPRHRIDPQIDNFKEQANFKYEVQEPEKQHHGLVCASCINRELVH